MHISPRINPESLLRIRQIIGDPKASPPIPALVSCSKSTWWAWSASGVVGAPIRIGGATFWRASDVLRLADRAANDANNEPAPSKQVSSHTAGGRP